MSKQLVILLYWLLSPHISKVLGQFITTAVQVSSRLESNLLTLRTRWNHISLSTSVLGAPGSLEKTPIRDFKISGHNQHFTLFNALCFNGLALMNVNQFELDPINTTAFSLTGRFTSHEIQDTYTSDPFLLTFSYTASRQFTEVIASSISTPPMDYKLYGYNTSYLK